MFVLCVIRVSKDYEGLWGYIFNYFLYVLGGLEFIESFIFEIGLYVVLVFIIVLVIFLGIWFFGKYLCEFLYKI